MADYAGRDDRCTDLRHAAHHGVAPEDRHQPLGGVDAVLQRNDSRIGTDQRFDLRTRAFDIPQLDAKQHDIDLANIGGIVGCPGRHEMGLAAAALDFQALLLHGGKMGAARDKGDIGARLGQRRAESTSDTSSADNRNPHRILLA